MHDDMEEIVSMVTAKEGEHDLLRSRMEEDFDLLTLLEYVPKDSSGNARKGYESYTSSAPRNIFDKVLDGLNQAALSIQIKLQDDASEKDRRASSKGELYLFGAFHSIDRRLSRRGEPPLREGLGFFICLRGWWGVRVLVYVAKGKTDVIFDVQPWDPMNMTWESGPDGLLWAANKVTRTKAQIEAEYGYTIEGKQTEVIDFWDTEGNAVIIGGSEWGKKPTAHEIGHVPVQIGAIGSMPTLQGRTGMGGSAYSTHGMNASNEGGAIQYRGDSVWAASRGLYDSRNSQVSTLMDIQKRASVGSLVLQTDNPSAPIEGDPYAAFKIITLRKDETLKNLELPQAPPETAALLTLMDQDIQQSTLPYPLAYGGTTQALSGRALSFLSDRTRSVFSPRTGAMSIAYSWLCEELLSQYVKKGFKPTELQGYNPDGEFFQVKVTPKDLKPSWFVEVKVEPRLPRDEEAEIQMALAATAKRGADDLPLLSKQSARENILQIRDPDAEEDRVLVEQAKSMPPIIGARVAAALKAAGDDEGAELILAYMASQGLGPPPPNGGPQGPQSPPNGAGMPPGPGQAPQQEPPEFQVIKVILSKLTELGADKLARAMAQALDSGQPVPPELLDLIVRFLTDSGEQQAVEALVAALGAPRQPQGV